VSTCSFSASSPVASAMWRSGRGVAASIAGATLCMALVQRRLSSANVAGLRSALDLVDYYAVLAAHEPRRILPRRKAGYRVVQALVMMPRSEIVRRANRSTLARRSMRPRRPFCHRGRSGQMRPFQKSRSLGPRLGVEVMVERCREALPPLLAVEGGDSRRFCTAGSRLGRTYPVTSPRPSQRRALRLPLRARAAPSAGVSSPPPGTRRRRVGRSRPSCGLSLAASTVTTNPSDVRSIVLLSSGSRSVVW